MFSFSSILSLWRKPGASSSQSAVGIFDLPDELILDIAHHASPAVKPTTSDHQAVEDVDAPVALPSDLASLSRTNRVFHAILAPVVLREVNITSAKRLRSLALVPADKLALVKSLAIHLDFDFFIEFARSIDPAYRSLVQDPQIKVVNPSETQTATAADSVYPSPSLIHAFCTVLSSTSSLESLTIRLAKAQDRPSAWRNFAYRQIGLSFGKAFETAMNEINSCSSSHSPAILLPRLKHVHLDAMEDIAPLLRRAPSLTSLSLRMLEGFETESCLRLLDDVKSSGGSIKTLALSAQSLALPCVSGTRDTSTGFDLVEEIGKACPALEELDLRTRTYDHSTFEYLTTFSNSEYSDLAATLLNFPYLKTLHLPGNLLTPEQADSLEAPSAHNPEATKTVLDRVTAHEREAVQALTVVVPSLQRVSFIRPKDNQANLASVQYTVPISSQDSAIAVSASSTAAWEIPANLCSSPHAKGGLPSLCCSGREVLEFASDHPALVTAAVMSALVGAAVVAGGAGAGVGVGAKAANRGDVALMAYSGVVVVGMVYGKIVDGAKAVARAADNAAGMVTSEISKRAQVVIF